VPASGIRLILILSYGLLVAGDVHDVTRIHRERLLREFAATQYPFGSRLSGMPYLNRAASDSRRGVFDDPLRVATSGTRFSQRRLLALLYIFDGRWRHAEEILRKLALERPRDATLQNDLGVIYMSLADSDPVAWFKAIRQFELASTAEPDLPEARFNLIRVYRRLRLHKLEAAALQEYKRIDPESPWHAALHGPFVDRADAHPSFASKVGSAQPADIPALVEQHPEEARKFVLNYVLRPTLPVPATYVRIASELSHRFGDHTARYGLAPILTEEFEAISRARHLVETARQLYFRGDLERSRKAYAQARVHISRTNSVFDELWIEVNDADAATRMLNYAEAARMLRGVVKVSRADRLQWLLANALAAFGANPRLVNRSADTLSHLNQAVQIYRTIGARQDSARSLYYLAAYNYSAHNFEESLTFALDSLAVTDAKDHVRLSQLHWLISNILRATGYLEFAVQFNEQASEHAETGGNAGLIASMRSQLASLYLTIGRNREAQEQIAMSARAVQQMPSADDRSHSEFAVNVVRAQVLMAAGDYSTAEQMLRKDTIFFSRIAGVSRTLIPPQAHVLLARALAAQGKAQLASVELRNGINLVEAEQDQLSTLSFQVSFDQQRRQVYESAIGFEYDQNNCEESWTLTQGYKSKLFLEVLRRFDAPIDRLQSARLSRSEVENRVPENTRLVDYAVFADRILMWVLSRDGLQCRSTKINRYQLQRKVEAFLRHLSENGASTLVQGLSEDLHDLLVEPIRELLDSNQTVVIIPDGILHRLPFAALRSRNDHRYLIERMPIVQSPSISYFFSENPSPVSSTALVAFGSRTHDVLMNRELTSLQEIEPAIQLRTGSLVTKEEFLGSVGKNFLVYYAGHSAFDVADPLRSLILLDGDKPGPNSVSALDIIERRMPKNGIVILAACDTSLGNFTDGPGIRGLTSAFLVAGAGSVVGSLWPIQSSSTARFMPIMFKSLTHQNVSVAESLRSAQLQLIRSGASDPYHWAGFVVTGNLSATVQRSLTPVSISRTSGLGKRG
jgi:CHAT domain-containing protein